MPSFSSGKQLKELQTKKATLVSKEEWKKACPVTLDLAAKCEENGLYEEAEREYKDLADFHAKMGELAEQGKYWRAMAEVNATHLHRFSEAERLGKLYLERMRDLGDPVGIQQAQASIGYIHDLHARNLHDKGRNNHQVLVKAARQFELALDAVSAIPDRWSSPQQRAEMSARCLTNLITVDKNLNDNEALLEHLNRLEPLVRQFSLPYWRFCYFGERTLVAKEKGDFDLALKFNGEAIKAFDKAHFSKPHSKLELSEQYQARAQLLLLKRSFVDARGALRQAIKVLGKSTSSADLEAKALGNRLRGVSKLVKLVRKLEHENCPRSDLCESLGDVATKLGLKGISIDYYEQALEETGDAAVEKKAELYFSIGMGYFDTQEYGKAEKYFQQEMTALKKLGNHQGAVMSWTKIWHCHKNSQKSFKQLETEIKQILDYAKSMDLYKEEIGLLHLWADAQAKEDLPQEEKETLARAKELVSLRDIDEEEIPSYLNEEDDEACEFSSVSESDDDSGNTETSHARISRYKLKRNDKGETELHRLCQQEGKLDLIRQLLLAGHPVDVEDKFEFTALHEACNYGHADYVELLLDSGAAVNRLGGQEARVTPLIDACSGGHLDVVKLLLERGASPYSQDKDGWLAIDHLKQYLKNKSDQMREEEVLEGKRLLSMMKGVLDKRAKSGQEVYVIEKKQTSTALMTEGGSHREESPAKKTRFHQKKKAKKKNLDGAAIEYVSAISGMRNKRTANQMNEEDLEFNDPPVEEEEEAFDDNWLVDDLARSRRDTRKRSRTECLRTSTVVPFASRTTPPPSPPPQSSPRSPLFVPRGRHKVSNDFEWFEREEAPAPTTAPPPPPASSSPPPAPTPSSFFSSSSSANQRHQQPNKFTIVVNETKLVVALEGEVTVGDLVAKTSSRYEESRGVRPKLVLLTPDGGELFHSDLISQVLADQTQLNSRVEGWQVPSLAERYSAAGGSSSYLKRCLVEADDTSKLIVEASVNNDSAFFKSLRQQSTLTELILKSCRLFDEGMADLADIVFSLGGLNVLNISLNGLTAAAVTYLTRAASKKQESPSLKLLDLSYNSLGDDCLVELSELVRLCRLDRLRVVSCRLTKHFSMKASKEQKRILADLQDLDASFNDPSLEEQLCLLRSA